MGLPSMPAGMDSREYLRVAGGYGAAAVGTSPAGGLDVDNAGNLATDGDASVGGGLDIGGDVMVGGDLDLGEDGVNRAWSAWLDARVGAPCGSNPASGPTAWNLRADRKTTTLDFDTTAALIDATFQVLMPPDYDGAALKMELFWTCDSGTSGAVYWQISAACFADGGDVAGAWGSLVSMGAGFAAQLTQHVEALSVVPANSSSGNLMYILVRRNGSHGSDTFDGTARLQGIRISYA